MKILITAFKILLGLVLLAVLIFGIYYLVRYEKWPWWVGVVIFAGLLGLVLGGLFFKKWLFRRREKKFVQRIVEQDESVMPKIQIRERQELMDLESRWKEAVDILRRSHLKRHGNPLYVLPWYLILGETGSGKTTAIRSTRLHSPVTEVGSGAGRDGTRNCDWWFFDTAVIIDTAGRYSIHQDEILDKEEWQKFLGLLTRYRRKEPINGVILTVAADKLVEASLDTLSEDAQALRRRIDEVMRVLGARFPVYVLVTKLDRIMGVSEFGNLLSQSAWDQALGWMGSATRYEPGKFSNQVVFGISERLKDLRLLLLPRGRSGSLGLFIFPDEIAALGPKLRHFVETVFEENPYQETPILRGIYFGSGRQNGEAHSQIFIDPETRQGFGQTIPESDRSLFLSDLIVRVLPQDRDLVSPLREFISWRRLTKSLGLTAWCTVFLFLCGILTFSFLKNQNSLQAVTKDLTGPPVLTRNLSNDILEMGRLRNELLEVEGLNRNWWIPRMGLSQSLIMEYQLKDYYCIMFDRGFLENLDTGLSKMVEKFSANTRGQVIGAYVEHLVTRINLLQAAIEGASAGRLAKMPPPSYTVFTMDQNVVTSIASDFVPLYLSYLVWEPQKQDLSKELEQMQRLLAQVTDTGGFNLHWLVDWANMQSGLKPVTMAEFWGSDVLSGPDLTEVPGAYTIKGRDLINNFLPMFEKALKDPKPVTDRMPDFTAWYEKQYIKAWEEFGNSFDQGTVRLSDENVRILLASAMVSTTNPYFTLLDRMAEEFKPFADKKDNPRWVARTLGFQKVKSQASRDKVEQSSGILSKAAKEGESVLQKTMQVTGSTDLAQQEMIAKGAEQLVAYEKALSDIMPATTSRAKAFNMADDLYGSDDDKDESKSPFHEAYIAVTKLRNTSDDKGVVDDSLFWRLLTGPYYYLLAFTTHEAACELQDEWEGSVLAASSSLPPKKLQDTLFNEEKGLVWKFVQGQAKPFLSRNAQGYYARSYLGNEFPFYPEFLGFLDQGSASTQMILPEYEINISARPTTVNRSAVLEPQATVLILDCTKEPQRLENFNYPAELKYKYNPDECGNTTLEIRFADFTLTKLYTDFNGFPAFLEDFRDGTRTFTPQDFPEHENELKKIGIEFIRVTYVIQGSLPVRKLAKKQDFTLPAHIAECMGQGY